MKRLIEKKAKMETKKNKKRYKITKPNEYVNIC